MRKHLIGIILLTIFAIGMSFVGAYPDNVVNDASHPDQTGFTYMPILQWYTDKSGYIDYSDPTMMYKITLQNTQYVPNLLEDSLNHNLIYNLYNFANEGSTQTQIGDETHYVLTIDTSSTTTSQPQGVTASQSGTYHYGVLKIDEDGDGNYEYQIKFWVVDTGTAGQYDTVFVDINNDLTIDYANLKVGSYFDLDHMRIVIQDISSDGNSIKIYNKWDNLVAGQASPLGTGILQQILQAHWVITPAIPYTVNAQNIELKLLKDNEYKDPTADDFVQLDTDTQHKTFTVTALLGGYGLVNYNIPTTRTVYVFFHLSPVDVTSTKDFDANTSTTVVTLEVKNNAGVELPQGYIRIENIAPSEAYEQIAKSLHVIEGGVQVQAEQSINGVDLIVKFPNLPTTGATVKISYVYKNELVEDIKNIQESVNNLNNKVDELSTTVNQQGQDITQIKSDIQTILQQLQTMSNTLDQLKQNSTGGSQVDLSGINQKLDDIQNTLGKLDQIQQAIADLQNNIKLADTQTMKSVYENEYNDVSSMVDELNNALNSMSQAIAGAGDDLGGLGNGNDNGLGDLGNGNDLGGLGGLGNDSNTTGGLGGLGGGFGGNGVQSINIDFTTQYTELKQALSMVSNEVSSLPQPSSLPDDPFVIMMYYQKLLMIKQELYMIKLQAINLEVATGIANDGISQLASIISTKSQALSDIQDQLKTINENSKKILTVQATVQQIYLWVNEQKQKEAQEAQNAQKKGGSNNMLMWGLIGLLVIVLVAYMFMGKKKESGGSTPEEAGMNPGMGGMSGMGGMPGMGNAPGMGGAPGMNPGMGGVPGVPPTGGNNMGGMNPGMGGMEGNMGGMGGQNNFGGFP